MPRPHLLLSLGLAAVLAGSVLALRVEVDPPATGTPPGPVLPTAPTEDRRPTTLIALDFADARHAFAVRRECRTGPNGVCQAVLLATDDGFRTTTEHALPEGVGGYAGGLTSFDVLGPGRLRIGSGTDYHSADGGLSWTKVTGRAEPVAVIPPGARLRQECGPGGCAVRVVLPDSGRTAALRTPPPLEAPEPGAVPARDGRWWVVGRRGERPAVASSPDGARWEVRELPPAPYRNWWTASVGGFGARVYAWLTGPGPQDRGTLVTLYRSDDRGQTWTRVPHRAELSISLAPVVGVDGELRVTGPGGRTLLGRDGGREFTPAPEPQALPDGAVAWTRGGYVAHTAYDHLVSWDGLSWTELPVS
ncbi:photosystem II stability/assembly factor-like uncharacterized protein [Crossiella equi]|uniref:Photosystem II stability/assembly factor-like uncharacterized protein n=1 Tax=Crossiella equi TaxID=130796 RepID=A0ABS5AMY3_9PSEU|nr:hypothetical protein [Crossiella equi]MBP2477918.1 photosystem II stability/assembly factor-like uncharacterized protein [Crossiella equi]